MVKHYEVVAGVVVHEGLVMCLRKGATAYCYTSHHWEFPGGKIEPGETAPQALQRELREELHLDVMVGEHLMTVNHVYPDFAITLHAYSCQTATTAVRLSDEAVCWLPPAQLCTLEWCEADAPIARHIADNL